jgi:hypothetical protein
MMQYFKDIISLFSITQRLWVLTILCVSTFFITFGSDIIEVLKPDPSQLILVVKRQKKEIISLNTQLDTLSFRVNDLTQEVIDGQSQCTNKRIEREKEIIAQIDKIMNMVRGSVKPHEMTIRERLIRQSKSSVPVSDGTPIRITNVDSIRVIPDDNTELAISALRELKSRIKNRGH